MSIRWQKSSKGIFFLELNITFASDLNPILDCHNFSRLILIIMAPLNKQHHKIQHIYIYIYIHIRYMLFTYRKLARVGFEPTTSCLPFTRSNH